MRPFLRTIGCAPRPRHLGLLLACAGLAAACTRNSPDHPDSPAAVRAAEFVALLNSGDRSALGTYVERSYTDSLAASMPLRQQVVLLEMLRARAPELRVERTTVSGSENADVLVRSEVSGQWYNLRVEVDPRPPHRVRTIRLERGEAPAGSGADPLRTRTDRARALDTYVRYLTGKGLFSGVVLLAEGEEPIYAAAFGEADREARRPIRVETPFNLASTGKMFTAVAVAQLVEAGKLSFDAPLSRYLPDVPNVRDARQIRIKHLLSHTAGLGNYMGSDLVESRAASVDEMMRFVEDGVGFPPGTRWEYSNSGYLVLGKIIEKASGESYYDFVREHIFRPAGMVNTGFPTRDLLPPGAATGYDRARGLRDSSYTSNLERLPFRGGPAGGGYSTAEDLLRFAEALHAGRLVSPAMVRVLTTPKPELASPRYGFGFQVDPRRAIVGHGGSFPGIDVNVDIFLDRRYTAVVLSNRYAAARPVVERIRDLVRGPGPGPIFP